MKWYFNFDNARGLSLHSYALPGYPASHACVRLLERDAIWIYEWGEGWTLTATGGIITQGTPLIVAGQYGFGAPPPWKSLAHLAQGITLPEAPLSDNTTASWTSSFDAIKFLFRTRRRPPRFPGGAEFREHENRTQSGRIATLVRSSDAGPIKRARRVLQRSSRGRTEECLPECR
jgi:hypothetical protein